MPSVIARQTLSSLYPNYLGIPVPRHRVFFERSCGGSGFFSSFFLLCFPKGRGSGLNGCYRVCVRACVRVCVCESSTIELSSVA